MAAETFEHQQLYDMLAEAIRPMRGDAWFPLDLEWIIGYFLPGEAEVSPALVAVVNRLLQRGLIEAWWLEYPPTQPEFVGTKPLNRLPIMGALAEPNPARARFCTWKVQPTPGRYWAFRVTAGFCR